MPKILIVGGGGSIGSELCRQLKHNEIFILDQDETAMFDLYEELRLEQCKVKGRVGDIRNRQTVRDVMEDFQPNVIYMAAALKHVTPAEHTPRESIETNLIGLCNILDEAKRHNVEKLIFISSDKAVDNNKVYGLTKRMGELMVKNAGYVSVRFGNVLGSRGSLIPIWDKQIKEGKNLTVTDERMERFFMTIEEAVNLVIKAAEFPAGSLVILDMGKPIKIIDLAKKIIKESGRDLDVKIIGARPGETLGESLMTKEEELRAIKQGEFYVLTN